MRPEVESRSVSSSCYTLSMEDRTLATIGHSTHPIEEFLELLRMHAIQLLVDVRTIP